MRSRFELTLMALAALSFGLATSAMLAGWEPIATWYYSFAWWSYIVFVDAWLGDRRPHGTILRNPEAPRLVALSVVIWVSFEVYNFRLHNWHYLEIPAALSIRWTGYTIAYATVLPGIFVTWRLLETLFPPRTTPQKSLPSYLPSTLLWGGLAASVLPWFWPRYLFPLVWLGPSAFFAAINYRLGNRGILRRIEHQGPATLYRLIAAGGICGLLWELWNFWARSKWVYDIPFFDWLHLFEMPLAGFLGFLPFAVECHEMYCFGTKGLEWLKPRHVLYATAWILLVLYVAAAYWGIDHLTVRTFQN